MKSLEFRGHTDYSKITSTRHNDYFVNGGIIYMSDLLSAGNSKLSNNILIFDLLAGDTCLNCSSCIKTCYAMKAQRQYSETYNKRAFNTYLAKYDKDVLASWVCIQLAKQKSNKYVRIHSSGDFISQEYVDMWEIIVLNNPKHTFYYYTKVDNIFDFTKLNSLPNCNMVHSILPDGDKNYGTLDYIQQKQEKYPQAKICQYGMQANIKCGENCTLCMHNEYILFKQH